jgi:predicted XRE-type DNA-binding protein
MDNVILWTGLALLIAFLTFMNQKQLYSSKVKQAYRELRELTEKVRLERSEASDLHRWEIELAEMEKHPNELNKLDAEIGLRQAFVLYLERHYQQDMRLPSLKEAAAYQKDSVWGIKMGDYGPKK